MKLLREYYRLAKPGIIYGNIITTIGGFLLASKFHGNLSVFIGVVLGTALVIGSACVFNNYIDRDIDEKMTRTKKRALVTGTISNQHALIYGTILGIIGLIILATFTNTLTILVGLVGFIDYVFLYTFSKRTSVHSTLIGTVSGATPILAGYTAVTNRLDAGGIILFLIMVLWQMPHFYAIAMYRREDYKAAGIPVLTVKSGNAVTKNHMAFYVVAFIAATLLLSALHITGYTYAVVLGVLGLYWLWIDIQGFFVKDEIKWARKMFFFSLIIMMVMSVMIPLGVLLP